MHPAVAQVLDRVFDIEWHYMLFDYGTVMGVCGETHTGRRQAVRFKLPHPTQSITAAVGERNQPLIERAKKLIIESLARGEGTQGDEVIQGNELTMETTS